MDHFLKCIPSRMWKKSRVFFSFLLGLPSSRSKVEDTKCLKNTFIIVSNDDAF